MVGFGIRFLKRQVPEWMEKYLEYDLLKSRIAELQKTDENMQSNNDEILTVVRETRMLPIKSKHGMEIEVEISHHVFSLPSCSMPSEHDFFLLLNDNFRRITEFQHKILQKCHEEVLFLSHLQRMLLQHIETQGYTAASWYNPVKNLSSVGVLSRRRKLVKAYEHALKLLKMFQSHVENNKQAASKILKKHDKASSSFRMSRKIFLTAGILDGEFRPFGTCNLSLAEAAPLDPINPQLCVSYKEMSDRLIERIEENYVLLRTHPNWKEGTISRSEVMSELRRNAGIERARVSHWSTFIGGTFAGALIPLLLYSSIFIFAKTDGPSTTSWWLLGWIHFRLGFLITLQILLWAVNLHAFHLLKINHTLILNIAGGSETKFDTVFLLAGALFLSVFAAFMFFSQKLLLEQSESIDSEWLLWLKHANEPIFSVVALIMIAVILFSPFPSVRMRIWLGKRFLKMLLVPLIPVDFSMAFLADQLCSNVRIMQDTLRVSCFAVSGVYSSVSPKNSFCFSPAFESPLGIACGLIPLYMRTIQCCRRFFDFRWPNVKGREPQLANAQIQLYNALKYVVSMTVVISSVSGSQLAWIVSASVATFYTFYWDVWKDWGLGDIKYFGLRKNLLLRTGCMGTAYYYVAIASNLAMRCVWVLTISPSFLQDSVDKEILLLVFAAIELLRRAQWNLLRMEMEQCHNTQEGKAVKEVHVELSEVLLTSEITEQNAGDECLAGEIMPQTEESFSTKRHLELSNSSISISSNGDL